MNSYVAFTAAHLQRCVWVGEFAVTVGSVHALVSEGRPEDS